MSKRLMCSLCVLGLMTVHLHAEAKMIPYTDLPMPEPVEVDAAIFAATDRLLAMQQQDGRFVYRVHLDPEVEIRPAYNMLRHAGTLYSLCQSYQYAPQPRLKEAIIQGADYLKDVALGPVEGEEGLLAIWSRPEIVLTQAPLQAKLGGAGLGLVALCNLEKIEPGSTPLEELRGLAAFILHMQKHDGSFFSKYYPEYGGRYDQWASLFYPGEAALGLLMLYRLDPDPRWLDGATRALQYLARSREGELIVPADHWALLATEAWMSLPQTQTEAMAATRQQLFDHALQIGQYMLGQQRFHGGTPPIGQSTRVYYGGFDRHGRTTPTATRLEGLIGLMSFLPEDHRHAKRLSIGADAGITFLLGAQLKAGDYRGGFPRSVAKLQGDSEKIQSLNQLQGEIRIDYIQHALSALTQYQQRGPKAP